MLAHCLVADFTSLAISAMTVACLFFFHFSPKSSSTHLAIELASRQRVLSIMSSFRVLFVAKQSMSYEVLSTLLGIIAI
jgi:hypothetical protein